VRGDVYRLKAPRDGVGHEQKGNRFAIIVQSDDLYSSTTIVVPTSTSAQPMDHRPVVKVLGRGTAVLPEQVMTIDPVRLGERVDRLSLGELQLVDDALRLVMALD
jgi:mRNA interferase MazF